MADRYLFVSQELSQSLPRRPLPGTLRARRNDPGPDVDHYRGEPHPRVPGLAVRMGRIAKKLDRISSAIEARDGGATKARAQLGPSRFAIASMVARASHDDVINGRRLKVKARVDAEIAEAKRRKAVREAHASPVAMAA
jgi:hypothetical protein